MNAKRVLLVGSVALCMAFTTGCSTSTKVSQGSNRAEAASIAQVVSDDHAELERAVEHLNNGLDSLESTTKAVDRAAGVGLVRKAYAGYTPKSGATLDLTQAVVRNQNRGSGKVMWVPLVASDLESHSGVAAVTGDNGQTAFLEIAMTPLASNAGRVQIWRDGQAVINKIVNNDGQEITESQLAPARVTAIVQAGLSWSRLNSCLSNAGIAAWVIAGLALFCSLPCATIVGCIPCVGAAIGLVGTAGYCVKKAWV